jgi:acetolactate synthase I/II/III large subunit
MVHVTVGTGNLLTAIMNASRARIPTIFTAGRTPITERGLRGARNLHIHWAQESFDQGAIAREWTKWDYELRNFEQLETVVDRALSVAMAEPRGPVYLTLPREVLAQSCESFSFRSDHRSYAPTLDHPVPEGVGEAADILSSARNPLIITSAVGLRASAVAELMRLSELAAIPVVEAPGRYFMNFPTSHPMHAGFDPHPLMSEADAILVIEADTPWFPSIAEPQPGAPVIHLGADPIHVRYPIWGFPVDIAITAQPSAALAALSRALEALSASDRGAVGERRERVTEQHRRRRIAWREHCASVRAERPINPAWLSHCINEVKGTDSMIVNEYDLSPFQTDFVESGTYFGSPPAGGLGWGLGAALGVKLAAPERTVICTVGDGSYMFGVPTAAHYVSQSQNLPILFVIFNNSSWKAVRDATLHVHPDGWGEQARSILHLGSAPIASFREIGRRFRCVWRAGRRSSRDHPRAHACTQGSAR